LNAFSLRYGEQLYKNRDEFLKDLNAFARETQVHLSANEYKPILEALSQKDETADTCYDAKGKPEPDPDLRDTENVPLKEDVKPNEENSDKIKKEIQAYFQREVLPHVPDAWIDYSKTKIGFEIPFNRHFYRYRPPRTLDAIEADIKALETEIMGLLSGKPGDRHEV